MVVKIVYQKVDIIVQVLHVIYYVGMVKDQMKIVMMVIKQIMMDAVIVKLILVIHVMEVVQLQMIHV